MPTAKQRRLICAAAMVFSGLLMVWITSWVTKIPPETTNNAHSLLVGAVFAPVAAIFKFALDAYDGKIEG